MCHCEEPVFATKQSPNRMIGDCFAKNRLAMTRKGSFLKTDLHATTLDATEHEIRHVEAQRDIPFIVVIHLSYRRFLLPLVVEMTYSARLTTSNV